MKRAPAIWLLLSMLLSACATKPPLDAPEAVRDVAPAEAVQQVEQLQGTQLLWGGRIIDSSNLEDKTRLEVLAYPLNEAQRPQLDRPPLGRFLVTRPGYLETATYAPGRLVTVSGELDGVREGRIGEAHYRYPELRAEQVHLWPEEQVRSTRPRVTFGVGVIFGR